MVSAFSSRTLTASSADLIPPFPLKNLPGPKTEQVAAFRIAQSSSPMAQAVKLKYSIYVIVLVSLGKFILKELNPKPANIAAIPAIEEYNPTK